ncbi:hypothetical protein [Streptomyces sp. NBC_01615]|uniref:hypothetical protein n=1 Tax=Streptomyces sp. NBC_01615 TaxID=2975898 RepID=UPI003866DA1B
MQETAAYEVWHRDSLVGVLRDVSVDQPWFRCGFVPGAGWDELSALFAAQEEARRQHFPEELIGAVAAVRDLGVELRPVYGGETIRPWMIYLSEEKASFRY